MSIEAQELEVKKNNFYRDNYRRTLSLILINAVVAIILIASLAYLTLFPRKGNYYATTTSGLVVPLHPLSEPVVTKNYMLQWASLATRAAYNIDFAHYQEDLQRAKPYFTSHGWDKFLAAIKSSGLLSDMIDKKLQMSAVVAGAPVILNQGDVHGRYTWQIQLPLLVTFDSASQVSKTKLLVTMNVSRVPVLGSPKGIQISDFESDLSGF